MGVEEIKGRIYVGVDYELANVVCIKTSQGLVLVDSPTLPEDVSHWKEYVNGLNSGGVEYIVTTHHHFDHIMGNNQLGGRVIMHETARAKMFDGDGTMRESMSTLFPGWTPEDVEFVRSEPLVEPEITFDDKMSLNMGDATIRLFHAGGHTDGSICVYIEEDRALITGDNVTCNHHPYRGEANYAEWINALRSMQGLDIDVIIPGHGDICGKDELNRLLEYLTRLCFITEDLIRKGMAQAEVIKEVSRLMIDYYEIEQDSLEGAKMMFNLGTARLYNEILSRI